MNIMSHIALTYTNTRIYTDAHECAYTCINMRVHACICIRLTTKCVTCTPKYDYVKYTSFATELSWTALAEEADREKAKEEDAEKKGETPKSRKE